MKERKAGGTHIRIWETVRCIPFGKVATYGEVAGQSGLPGQPRLVGYALHDLPAGLEVPWHRVINARGMISLRKRTRGHILQRKLLEQEGIVFRNDRVDLSVYGWLRAPRSSKRKAKR